GSFIGGIIGGIFLHLDTLNLLAIILVILALIWLVALFFLKNPADFKNLYLPLETPLNFSTFGENLGVVDIYKNSKNLVVKFDSKLTSKEELEGKL
ncbi:MFS transporter, partial [Campylobacter jejuni]|nr:MFS transporter [Campylobacter jejuni]